MKRIIILTGCTLLALSLLGCGASEETEPEKGKIEQMTEEVAEEAVRRINAPINQARDLQKDSEERIEGMEEQAEEE